MAIKKTLTNSIQNNQGQSLLEVIFVLPLLFLFVGLLYKANMAIQMSIVNVQYAHAQIYVLTLNSPEYPRLYFRGDYTGSGFATSQQDRMVLGVSDPSALKGGGGVDRTLDPVPQVQKIARKGTYTKGSTANGEAKLRNDIRIRNTSAICTQMNSDGKALLDEETIPPLNSKRWPFGMKVCGYKGDGG